MYINIIVLIAGILIGAYAMHLKNRKEISYVADKKFDEGYTAGYSDVWIETNEDLAIRRQEENAPFSPLN